MKPGSAFYIGWLIFMIATTISRPPWEHGWTLFIICLAIGIAVDVLSRWLDRNGIGLDAGEARFDSETGKPLPPYKDDE
ncbi:MAG: hypothetical protein AAF650_07000 [Pseudomonadota bacterium]